MYAHLIDKVVVEIDQAEDIGRPTTAIVLDGRKEPVAIGMVYDEKSDTFEESATALSQVSFKELCDAAITVLEHEVKHARSSLYADPEQLAIYTAKYYDAKAYRLKVMGDNVESYLWINAEVKATGCTADEAATLFITKHASMLELLADIERIRIEARSAIKNAKLPEEVRAAKSKALLALR